MLKKGRVCAVQRAYSSLSEKNMKRVEHLNQVEKFRKSWEVSREEKKEWIDQPQKKKPKRKRNSSPLSYIEVISYAILSSPQRRLTLAEIYSFIQENYPGFTENRKRWKNTVRHNLSLHQCFQRGEIAMDKIGCYWYIHPNFLAEFSRGDFSRRKLTLSPPSILDGMSSLHQNQVGFTSPVLPCHFCQSTPPFVSSFGSLEFHRRGLPAPYEQHPYFPRDHWLY